MVYITFGLLTLSGCGYTPGAPETPLRLLCSGQSNMAYTVARAESAGWSRPHDLGERLSAVEIRFATVAINPQTQPAAQAQITRKRVIADTVGERSALCMFTALDIAEREDRPVEFIVAALGGSRIAPWLPSDSAEALGLVKDGNRSFFADPEASVVDWQRSVLDLLDVQPAPGEDLGLVDIPGRWDDQGHPDLDDLVWLETDFELTAEQAH